MDIMTIGDNDIFANSEILVPYGGKLPPDNAIFSYNQTWGYGYGLGDRFGSGHGLVGIGTGVRGECNLSGYGDGNVLDDEHNEAI